MRGGARPPNRSFKPYLIHPNEGHRRYPAAAVRRLTLIALAVALVAPTAASASDRLDVNATHVRLAVNKSGIALVTYRARGRTGHALVWGAKNALPPSQTVPQGRFRIDWTGGWADFPPPPIS